MFAKIINKSKNKENIFEASSIDYIIVGLGNVGREYENTRHNAGFITIDILADDLGVNINKLKFKSLCCTANIEGKKILLLKPQTYMNLSGQAVTEAMSFYKIPPEKVIIIFDDISLDVGKMRIRKKGSDGGQNGMKNIIYLSGSDAFPRIKIGIGAKPNPNWNLADWVLSHFTKEESVKITDTAKNACEAVKLMINGEIDKAMNKFN